MSADWYFLKTGWLGNSHRVGPLSDHDLITRIDHGEIQPETLMQSDTKTKGRWVKMKEVPPAIKRWRDLHPSK